MEDAIKAIGPKFTKYALKQTLIAANAIQQEGSQWKLTDVETSAIGIGSNVTFTTQDAAVDAVYAALYTQFEKQAA